MMVEIEHALVDTFIYRLLFLIFGLLGYSIVLLFYLLILVKASEDGVVSQSSRGFWQLGSAKKKLLIAQFCKDVVVEGKVEGVVDVADIADDVVADEAVDEWLVKVVAVMSVKHMVTE